MKKLMLMTLLMTVGVAITLAGNVAFTTATKTDLDTLFAAQKYTELKAVLASLNIQTAYEADTVLRFYCCTSVKESGGVTTVDAAKAKVASFVPQAGSSLLNPQSIANCEINVLYWSKQFQLVYDYYKALTPEVRAQAARTFANACVKLQKNDEAILVFIQIKQHLPVLRMYKEQGNKDKAFEYARKAALTSYCSATALISILDIVGAMDFSGTAVTPAMQADFLKAVDLKYRRFLVTDKVTWEPIIASIRLTLQGYGVEVK